MNSPEKVSNGAELASDLLPVLLMKITFGLGIVSMFGV